MRPDPSCRRRGAVPVRAHATALYAALAGAVVAVPVTSAAQETVTVDLSAGTWTPSPPFDEAFYIEGDVTEHVRRVTLRWGFVAADAEDAYYWPKQCKDDIECFSQPIVWEPTVTDDRTFRMLVGPLHHRAKYTFDFAVEQTSQVLGDTEQLEMGLRTQLQTDLDRMWEDFEITDSEWDDLGDSVQAFVERVTPEGVDLRGPGGGLVYNLDNYAAATAYLQARADVLDALQSVDQDMSTVIGSLSTNPIRTALETVAFRPGQLLLRDSANVERPLNPALTDLSDVTMRQAAGLTLDLAGFAPYSDGLARGRLRIQGTSFAPTSAPHPASLQLIADALQVLQRRALRLSGGQQLVGSDAATAFGNTATLLRGIAQDHEVLITARNAQLGLPGSLSRSIATRSYALGTQALAVPTQKSPYVGGDFGLLWVQELQEAVPYMGMNFYAVPVNLDRTPWQYSWWDGLKKSFALHVGFTVRDFADDRVESLWSAGNPTVGAGFRVTAHARVNLMILWFKERDPRTPLVVTTRVRRQLAPALSWDADVFGFLGDAGTKLKNLLGF